jgi:hypothetical protein
MMDGPLDRKDSVSIQRTESKKEIAALAGWLLCSPSSSRDHQKWFD